MPQDHSRLVELTHPCILYIRPEMVDDAHAAHIQRKAYSIIAPVCAEAVVAALVGRQPEARSPVLDACVPELRDTNSQVRRLRRQAVGSWQRDGEQRFHVHSLRQVVSDEGTGATEIVAAIAEGRQTYDVFDRQSA